MGKRKKGSMEGWLSTAWESHAVSEWSHLLGDCASYEACPLGEGLAVNIDGYSVEESLLPGLLWSVWGWRSLTACLGDIYALGAEPVAAGFSVGLGDAWSAWEVLQGFLAATRYYGVEPVKSDSNSPGGGRGWIDVYCLGRLLAEPIPNRAPPGDYLVVQLGYSGYGLLEKRILEGWEPPPMLLPLLKRKLPTRIPLILAECGASAARDNSDGYLYTLELLAGSSRLDIQLTRPPLVDPRLLSLIRDQWGALESWEDYNLLLLAREVEAECLVSRAREVGVPVAVVGRAVPGGGGVYRGLEHD